MELKSLLIGLAFTIGIFALKSGVGLHFFLSQKRRPRTKLMVFLLSGILYLLVFMVSSHILKRIDIIVYFDIVQDFLKSGMFIHFLMAGGLIIWGIVLLKREGSLDRGSLGWIALILPCPVCITVIFASSAFLLSYFPRSGYMAVFWAYLGFMVIVMMTVIGMTLWGAKSDSIPESILGAAMLIIAVYFFLSVIILPQFSDIDAVYRLASYQGEKQTVNTKNIMFFYSAMAAFFATGFWAMRRRIRRKNNWK